MNPMAVILLLLASGKDCFDEEEGLLLLPFLSPVQSQATQTGGSTQSAGTTTQASIDPTAFLLLFALGRKEMFGRRRGEAVEGQKKAKREPAEGPDQKMLLLTLALGALGPSGQLFGSTVPTTPAAGPPVANYPGSIDPTTLLLLTALQGRLFRGEHKDDE